MLGGALAPVLVRNEILLRSAADEAEILTHLRFTSPVAEYPRYTKRTDCNHKKGYDIRKSCFHGSNSTFQYRNDLQHSGMLFKPSSRRAAIGRLFGFTGARRSLMPACSGVRLPFLPLHS